MHTTNRFSIIAILITISCLVTSYAASPNSASDQAAADHIIRQSTRVLAATIKPDLAQQDITQLATFIASAPSLNYGSLKDFRDAAQAVASYLLSNTEAMDARSNSNKDVQQHDRTVVVGVGAHLTPTLTPVAVDGKITYQSSDSSMNETTSSILNYRNPKASFDHQRFTALIKKEFKAYENVINEFYKHGFTVDAKTELTDCAWNWQFKPGAAITFLFHENGTFDAWFIPSWEADYEGVGIWSLKNNKLDVNFTTKYWAVSILHGETPFDWKAISNSELTYISDRKLVLKQGNDELLFERKK